ncbi:MAG: hypothetical protein R3A13_06135 [Bdellovibrionota bacterium]
MEEKLRQLEAEIELLKTRNQKVEADKAWEISLFRKILIFIGTYFITVVVFLLIGVKDPLLNGLIPAVAYSISTLTLAPIKKAWLLRILPPS